MSKTILMVDDKANVRDPLRQYRDERRMSHRLFGMVHYVGPFSPTPNRVFCESLQENFR